MKLFWGIVASVGVLFGVNAQAQNAFPPSNILKVGSQLTFELRQQWTGTVSGKDSDGDWTGDARSGNGTTGKFFGFAVQGGYAFQVGTTSFSEYCLLSPNNAVVSNSGGVIVYQGGRLSQQGNSDPVNDNATCRVTVSNGTNPPPQPTQPAPPPQQQQPIQPPGLPGAQAQLPTLTFPPRLEVGQRWEFRLGNRAIVYRAALTGSENRSGTAVYTGTLVTDGVGDPIASRKLEVFFTQDTLAAYATDPQGGVTVCSFQGAASLQNNVLTGTVFYRAPGQSQFSTLTAPSDAPCRANLEPIQGAQQPVNPVQPPPTQTLTPTLPALVGDTWRIVANGNLGLEPWVVSFTRADPDGVYGTAVQGAAQGNAEGFKTNDGSYAFLMTISNRQIACLIAANAPVTSGAFLGQLIEVAQNQVKSLNTSCTTTLTARGASGGTGGGGGGITPPPVQTINASFPPKVGQTWTLNIDGLAPWSIRLTATETDGTVKGQATQSGTTRNAFVFVDSGEQWFQVFGGNLVYFCIFPARPQINGATVLGGQAFSAPDANAQLTRLNRGCTVTLTAQTLLTLYKVRTEQQNMPIKLSPLF